MGQIDGPKKVDWERPASKCKWCGKPEVSVWWSGKKGQYCSFRCNAAGMYPRSVAIAVTVTALTSIVILISLQMQIDHPSTTLPSFFGWMLAVPVIVSVQFIYMAYLGRLLVKERESEVLQSSEI
jgi:hypothetical protein